MSGRLASEFYDRDVVEVARDLVGCTLKVDGVGGLITETEAYHEREAACHAYVGLTKRTATLFGPPGTAYVYISYGVHRMINCVCEPEGVGAAVLIRAIEPQTEVEEMAERRGLDDPRLLCSGPGKLTQSLAIGTELNQRPLGEAPFAITARAKRWDDEVVGVAPRIGITRAEELPWRFCLVGSRYLSRPIPKDGPRI